MAITASQLQAHAAAHPESMTERTPSEVVAAALDALVAARGTPIHDAVAALVAACQRQVAAAVAGLFPTGREE